MILLDYWPLGRFQSTKRDFILWQLKEKIPFFILSAIFSIIQVVITHPLYSHVNKISYLGFRFGNAAVAFVTYLEKIFYPHDMHLFHTFLIQPPVWQILGSLLLILVISVFVIVTVKHLPYLFVGWLWYVITLLPVIGFYGSVFFMHEHYTYLPSIGISIMLGWGIPILFPSSYMSQKILFPAGTFVLAIFAIMSWQECGYWKNNITLYSHALQMVTKDKYLVYNTRGAAYAELGQYQRAIENYSNAIRLKPDYIQAYTNRALAYFKYGDIASVCRDAQKACELGSCTMLESPKGREFCH
jgi:hypothetical protein